MLFPCLDSINQDDGSTKVTVYRKPTHTDQYLNFSSDPPLVHKRSVVRTLYHRADLITNDNGRQQEIEHVKNAFRTNGYPEWMFKLPRKKLSDKETSERTISVSIPYISRVSERLARSFKDHGVDMYHKPCNTLRSILVHPKDKTDKTMTVLFTMQSAMIVIKNTLGSLPEPLRLGGRNTKRGKQQQYFNIAKTQGIIWL